MILVTGGTGFVGQEVVKELLRIGYRVRLLVRDTKRAGAWAHNPHVELVQGDLLKLETLPPALAGVSAVIHLVGIIAETSRVTYEQAHVEATRHLLAAATDAGVTRWVQMSAAGTREFARSRYHRTKWQAEELVRKSGLDWTIFRPSLIYGYDERDRLLNMMRRVVSFPVDTLLLHSFPLIDGGSQLIQPVSVREVAHCFAQAPAKEASVGQTYDMVGPVAFTWREMIFKILGALGKKGIYEEIPLLLILRKLLWGVIILGPVVVIIMSVMHHVSLVGLEIALTAWVILLVLALRWRQTIIFCVPGELLIAGAEPLNDFAPRELRGSEVLKMAVEDNIGDPRPARWTFAYVPETFEQGLARIYH